MTMTNFIELVDRVLEEFGYEISIWDLPDVKFYVYFDDSFSPEEAREAAEDVVADLVYDGVLPALR